MESYIPWVLRGVHAEWQHEFLDGVIPASAVKTGDDGIELIGVCILMSDQTVTPFRLKMRLDATADEVAWLNCWLGENTSSGMLRIPFSGNWSKFLFTLPDRLDEIKWSYHVGFGDRDS